MSQFYQLEFEAEVVRLEQRIKELEADLETARRRDDAPLATGKGNGSEASPDGRSAAIRELRSERDQRLESVYSSLTPWQTVRVARHPDRPQTLDYVRMLCKDFAELHGDRRYGDDPAIVTGLARLGGHKVLLIGHNKGKTTQEKLACHFGCAHPEGYRKAMQKMRFAEKFNLPIVTLVDTPGAYPGIGAEQRGQAEAIAVNLLEMSRLRTPILSVVIGEGGSGGALGIAVADRVAMLEHAWYSVISPEGCAAILWKEANERTNTAAADSLKLTARDNLRLGTIDSIIQEPVGGAHRDPISTANSLERWITTQIEQLQTVPRDTLVSARYQRFRKMGQTGEHAEPTLDPEPKPVHPGQTAHGVR